jgi:hypothetical protein
LGSCSDPNSGSDFSRFGFSSGSRSGFGRVVSDFFDILQHTEGRKEITIHVYPNPKTNTPFIPPLYKQKKKFSFDFCLGCSSFVYDPTSHRKQQTLHSFF